MNGKKIFFVEDDESLGFVIKDNLEQKGFSVDLYKDGAEAWRGYQSNSYDLCLMDIMLPKLDGLSLAQRIRDVDKVIPLIFLTAKSQQEDKLCGFEIGADDYITKPFSISELIYRVNVFMKRSQVVQVEEEIKLGKYLFNPKRVTLKFEDKTTRLTHRESEILSFLYQRKNTVAKRKDLLISLWGDDDYFKGRSLDVFISKLRKYLSQDSKVDIENVHGVGFLLTIQE